MAKIIKSGIGNTVSISYRMCAVRIGLYIFLAVAGASLVFFTYAISLVLLFPLLLIRRERTKMLILKHGIEGEIATMAVLKRLPRAYFVCPDVTITNGPHKAQMDHVVVGPNGVFVVETKNHKGVISGDDNDHDLLQKKKTNSGSRYTKRFYSPIRQVETHARVLTQLLKQNGYPLKAQGVVYFSYPKTKVRVRSGEIPVFSARRGGQRRLLWYIRHSKTTKLLTAQECKIIANTIANHR
ncbi:MAG: nuclease-related domain-containing protein [Acetanaerobacterium sp.]